MKLTVACGRFAPVPGVIPENIPSSRLFAREAAFRASLPLRAELRPHLHG